VLGEVDALLLQLLGLLVGEVDLDRGLALVRELFAEFVGVLSGRRSRGICSFVTSARKTLTSSASGAVGTRRVPCAWAIDGDARAAQERADSEDRSRSVVS
jgi:hypothetical protein